MDNQSSEAYLILVSGGIMGLIFIPIWLPPTVDWIISIFRKIGRLRDNMRLKIDSVKKASRNTRRQKQRMKDSKVIVSVESEPVQKTTSDGRMLEFIKVKMKSGDVKELYKNVNFTYSWFWADDHSASPDDTPDVIRSLLDRYRIDHAKIIND